MSAASPTPAGGGSHFTSLGRRTSARQATRRPPSRPQLGRSESNPVGGAVSSVSKEARGGNVQSKQQYANLHDSSDDEIPVPMKLSALTKALLNDGGALGSARPPSPPQRPESRVMTRRRSVLTKSTSSATVEDKDVEQSQQPEKAVRETRRHARAGSTSFIASRPVSPVRTRDSSPAPRKRIVRLSTTPGGGQIQTGLRRSLSASVRRKPETKDVTDEKSMDHSLASSAPAEAPDVNTPAQAVRRVQISVASSSKNSSSRQGRLSGSSGLGLSAKKSSSAALSDHEMPEDPQTIARPQSAVNQGSIPRFGGSVRAREEQGVQSSMRLKRLGKVAGSFLSGPARRGRRRPSEEDSPIGENGENEFVSSNEHESQQQEHDMGRDVGRPGSSHAHRDFAAAGSPISSKELARTDSRKVSNMDLQASSLLEVQKASVEPDYHQHRPRPELPSAHDQENGAAPSAFQKRKPSISAFSEKGHYLDKKLMRPPSVVDLITKTDAGAASPDRHVLATISQNVQKTPHVVVPAVRPAPPPPPKMTVLNTVTATAGQTSKMKNVIFKVNGRTYQRVECIGRGGSAKVYRVTAENGKMFALKRVDIQLADATTVRGFKGEIDLLHKLSNVERVIKLFDYELNEEKKILTLLMEMGELDLNTLLRMRQNAENSKLDPVFVRFYWKEMLECLSACHAHDIVHSDLKPANFVVVRGRLKLIDFGIANAIQTDETINVHRESQIGTPNYMSPESLMDTDQYAFTTANNGRFRRLSGRGPKLMKLGKPSDVWSLGCILYQMVYGEPPFGHIPQQMARCHAIINWNHTIEFPERGLGSVKVPPSLIRTMRRCLNRDQLLRPTCDQLLSEDDPFLYPMEYAMDKPGMDATLPMTEDLLARIIQSVVTRCKDRLPTEGEMQSAWPIAYWTSVRKAVAEKGA